MKVLGWLLAGIVVGGIIAALKPQKLRSVVNKAEALGIDRAVFSIAALAAPAGVPRQVIRVLSA